MKLHSVVALLVPLVSSAISAEPLAPQCAPARQRADQLRVELEASLRPQAKTQAERYAAKPGPGVSAQKAWGDYAAAALLMGDRPVAAWAGLKAAAIRWSGDTVTNAGIYLYHLGKPQDALQLLNCAYAMVDRSPFLLEALAVVDERLGDAAGGRQMMQQAQTLAPDDRLIETETSFMTTGQPPPAPPPDPDDLDGALRELETHTKAALDLMKTEAQAIDRSLPGAPAGRYYDIDAKLIDNLLETVRTQVRQARAAPSALRQTMINSALSVAISSYAQVSDTLLTYISGVNGSSLLFWADVLGMDSALLGSESHRDATEWNMHGGPALATSAHDDYQSGLDAARKQRPSTCPADDPHCVRADARYCEAWKQLYERWETVSRERSNTAAHNFDPNATRLVIQAENELLQVRDYAVRQLAKMRFQNDVEQKARLQGVNQAVRRVYDDHFGSAGTVAFLRERAQWFQDERSALDEELSREREEMQKTCGPAERALLELLAQEQWQAYLDYLGRRLNWDIQPKVESELPCEGSIGPVTVSTDFEDLGSGRGKLDLKWKPRLLDGKVEGFDGGSTKYSGTGSAGVGVGIGQGSDASLGGGGSYGPFAGKVKVTLTTSVNPWNNQEYMGIKLKGSQGFALKEGKFGIACYPNSGSVTFYPRAFYDDAVKYLSTPSSRPPGTADRP